MQGGILPLSGYIFPVRSFTTPPLRTHYVTNIFRYEPLRFETPVTNPFLYEPFHL